MLLVLFFCNKSDFAVAYHSICLKLWWVNLDNGNMQAYTPILKKFCSCTVNFQIQHRQLPASEFI